MSTRIPIRSFLNPRSPGCIGKYHGGLGWFEILAPWNLVKPEFRDEFILALESSFSKSLWKQFTCITKKVKQIEVTYNVQLKYPWGVGDTLNFMLACQDLNLKPSLIKT